MLWQYTKQNVVGLYNQRQLRQLEEIVERMRVRKRLEAGEKHKTGSPPEPSGAGPVGRGGAAQWVSSAACGGARDMKPGRREAG